MHDDQYGVKILNLKNLTETEVLSSSVYVSFFVAPWQLVTASSLSRDSSPQERLQYPVEDLIC